MSNFCVYISSFVFLSAPSLFAAIGLSHVSSVGGNVFNVDQEFEASYGPYRDNTGFLFSSLGGFSFQYDGSFLDEGASLFFVEANDVFSEDKILGGDFVELELGTAYTLSQSFFLGVLTPSLDSLGYSNSFEPAYGWVELETQGSGELVLTDHAVAYGSQGIIVNTVIAVPEPSQASLLAFGVLSVLACRRR